MFGGYSVVYGQNLLSDQFHALEQIHERCSRMQGLVVQQIPDLASIGLIIGHVGRLGSTACEYQLEQTADRSSIRTVCRSDFDAAPRLDSLGHNDSSGDCRGVRLWALRSDRVLGVGGG